MTGSTDIVRGLGGLTKHSGATEEIERKVSLPLHHNKEK
jgi:hypothetical protein